MLFGAIVALYVVLRGSQPSGSVASDRVRRHERRQWIMLGARFGTASVTARCRHPGADIWFCLPQMSANLMSDRTHKTALICSKTCSRDRAPNSRELFLRTLETAINSAELLAESEP